MTEQYRSLSSKGIRLALAGVGNCASAFLEGISYYKERSDTEEGLLFPALCGYSVRDIDVVAAIDVSKSKVGLPLNEAIYQPPNSFVRLPDVRVMASTTVLRGPTLDGNPEHLARLVEESDAPVADIVAVLRERQVDILVNLLPTGSNQATEFYATAALAAGCGFVNCIPTPLAQRTTFRSSIRGPGCL